MALDPDDMKKIGGSDVAALLGVSEYSGPHDIYARIVHGKETPDSKPLRRGRLLEPVIREMAREDYGLKLLGSRSLRDPKRPYVRCSLDDMSREPDTDIPVEFKSVSPFAAHKWGDPGGDAIPEGYLAQVQFYLAESGAPRARVYALIGADELREYVVRADVELQAAIFEVVDKFYVDHIKAGVPPPPDASDTYSSFLTTLFPQSGAKRLPASAETEAWVRDLRAAEHDLAKAKAAVDAAKNALKASIGEAKGVEGDGWWVNWTTTRGREVTDWKAICAEARVSQELIAKHTERRPSFRTFRTSWSKEKADE